MKLGPFEIPPDLEEILIESSPYLQGLKLISPQMEEFPLRRKNLYHQTEIDIYFSLLSSSNQEMKPKTEEKREKNSVEIQPQWLLSLAHLFCLLDELEDDRTINFLIEKLSPIIPSLSYHIPFFSHIESDLREKIFQELIMKDFSNYEQKKILFSHPIFKVVETLEDFSLRPRLYLYLKEFLKNEPQVRFNNSQLISPSFLTLQSAFLPGMKMEFLPDQIIFFSFEEGREKKEFVICSSHSLIDDRPHSNVIFELFEYRVRWLSFTHTQVSFDFCRLFTLVKLCRTRDGQTTPLVLEEVRKDVFQLKGMGVIIWIDVVCTSRNEKEFYVRRIRNGSWFSSFFQTDPTDQIKNFYEPGKGEVLSLDFSANTVVPLSISQINQLIFSIDPQLTNNIFDNILRKMNNQTVEVFNEKKEVVGYYVAREFIINNKVEKIIIRTEDQGRIIRSCHGQLEGYRLDTEKMITSLFFDSSTKVEIYHEEKKVRLDGEIFDSDHHIGKNFSICFGPVIDNDRGLDVDNDSVTIHHRTGRLKLGFCSDPPYLLKSLAKE